MPNRTPTILPLDEEDAAAVLARAERRLRRVDPGLRSAMVIAGACRLRRRPNAFASLFRSILGQQVSSRVATVIAARLHDLCGGSITPEAIAALDDAAFVTAGVSRSKRDYLRALAAAVLAEPDFFPTLEGLPDEDVVARLTAIRGIGRWTAEMHLIFALGRLDVLPLGDLAVRTAIGSLFNLSRDTSAAAMMALAERWRPYRSVACWYLYAHLEHRRQAGTGGSGAAYAKR